MEASRAEDVEFILETSSNGLGFRVPFCGLPLRILILKAGYTKRNHKGDYRCTFLTLFLVRGLGLGVLGLQWYTFWPLCCGFRTLGLGLQWCMLWPLMV